MLIEGRMCHVSYLRVCNEMRISCALSNSMEKYTVCAVMQAPCVSLSALFTHTTEIGEAVKRGCVTLQP